MGPDASAKALNALQERFRPLMLSETSQPTHGVHEGTSGVRDGNGLARLYRIHLLEKTGRFERR